LIQLTSLEGIGHNSWSSTYATPQLYSWFNKQTITANRNRAKTKSKQPPEE